MTRTSGHVKFFRDQSGYGFIKPDDSGKELFVHRTDLGPSCGGDPATRTIEEGQRVSFGMLDTKKGPKAVDVEQQ